MSRTHNAVKNTQKESILDKSKENKIAPSEYGCEILLEKTTLEETKNPSFPTDAYLVWYVVGKTQYLDLTRCGKKVSLFDMYYDKYGPGTLQKIDLGCGRVSPKMWGYKVPEKKKRK